MRSIKFDRMSVKEPSILALYKFSFAKFDRPDVVDLMCQNSKFEPLDLSDSTIRLVL